MLQKQQVMNAIYVFRVGSSETWVCKQNFSIFVQLTELTVQWQTRCNLVEMLSDSSRVAAREQTAASGTAHPSSCSFAHWRGRVGGEVGGTLKNYSDSSFHDARAVLHSLLRRVVLQFLFDGIVLLARGQFEKCLPVLTYVMFVARSCPYGRVNGLAFLS